VSRATGVRAGSSPQRSPLRVGVLGCLQGPCSIKPCGAVSLLRPIPSNLTEGRIDDKTNSDADQPAPHCCLGTIKSRRMM
jgi:hypothetical protein